MTHQIQQAPLRKLSPNFQALKALPPPQALAGEGRGAPGLAWQRPRGGREPPPVPQHPVSHALRSHSSERGHPESPTVTRRSGHAGNSPGREGPEGLTLNSCFTPEAEARAPRQQPTSVFLLPPRKPAPSQPEKQSPAQRRVLTSLVAR